MDSCDAKCHHSNHGHSHTHSHKNHQHNHSHCHSHSHSHCHSHGVCNHSHHEQHSHQGSNRKKFLGMCFCSNIMRLSFMLALILSFFLVELVAGYVTRSITLTNDSFHMLSDAMGLFIALSVAIISNKFKSDDKQRIEVLGSLINSVFLNALCFKILIEAIERLFDPKQIKDIDLLLYVGLTGLIINLAGLFLFGHAHSHTHHHGSFEQDDDVDEELDLMRGIKIHSHDSPIKSNFILPPSELNGLNEKSVKTERVVNSLLDKTSTYSSDSIMKKKTVKCHILSSEANMNMRAAFLHVLADALGSVIVIISALVNKFQQELHVPKKLVDLIDPLLCLCLVGLILASALPLTKETSLFLLKSAPSESCSTSTKKESVSSIINNSSSVLINFKKENKTLERRHSMV